MNAYLPRHAYYGKHWPGQNGEISADRYLPLPARRDSTGNHAESRLFIAGAHGRIEAQSIGAVVSARFVLPFLRRSLFNKILARKKWVRRCRGVTAAGVASVIGTLAVFRRVV